MAQLDLLDAKVAGSDSFGLTNYDKLKTNLDYLAVAGATLASAATIAPTSEFHIVSGTTTVDTITPSGLTAVAGQQVRLLFQSALTVRNNGGGTGNIRTAGGTDKAVAANQIVAFVYDGAVWREQGQAGGFIVLADVTLGSAASTIDSGVFQTVGYNHLRIIHALQDTSSTYDVSTLGQFNADASAVYYYDFDGKTGGGSTVSGGPAPVLTTAFYAGSSPGANITGSGIYGLTIIDVPFATTSRKHSYNGVSYNVADGGTNEDSKRIYGSYSVASVINRVRYLASANFAAGSRLQVLGY